MGLDPSKVYICYVILMSWIGPEYNDVVTEWLAQVTYSINQANRAAGVYDPFKYMYVDLPFPPTRTVRIFENWC